MAGETEFFKVMNKNVIYTAIFGGYDSLCEPRVAMEGWDFICFTDQPIHSKHWQVRVVEPHEGDPTRTARKYKILPHRYLGSYDVSIWIDGNICVRDDVHELVAQHLTEVNMAVYDHAYAKHHDRKRTPDVKHSIYDDAQQLLELAARGRAKDDPDLIKAQVERYRTEGFPEDIGLALTMVLVRRHMKSDVVEAMEVWWEELKRGSKRDQLSFPYATWKTDLQFSYIKENVRENKYFAYHPHSKRTSGASS